LICQRRSTVVRRITDIPALEKLHEGANEATRENVCAVNVGAEDVPSGQFTTFCRTHEQPMSEESCAVFFGGNIGCGAIDPTAARQDAAVHVGNGSNPAGHGDSGATKTSGAIGDETDAPLDK
ncbi:hypothetical protein TcCL_NonESM08221, partial [Trypanosoma cruzi]